MRTASDEEFSSLIRQKLSEEVREFLESDDIKEIGDILEVISAIVKEKGFSEEEVKEIQDKKRVEKGDFSDKILWYGPGS